MSTSGDSADRVARSDAGGGNGALKGLAFKAGNVDLENSSTAWIDKIDSPAAAPRQADPPTGLRVTLSERAPPGAPPGAPSGDATRGASHRLRSLVTPQRASRWANHAFLAAVCILVAAAGWRVSRDHLSGWIEAVRPSASVAEQQQAAQASERAPERIQEPARPEASDQPPARRADAAPAGDRNAVLQASAGVESAPPSQASTPASGAAEPAKLAPPAPSQAASPQAASPEAARLLTRARLLLELGDIVTARVALERAAESGSPLAAFALAETYDPVVLSAWGAVGTRGDPAKAQQLYARAAAGGVETARDRLDVPRQPIRGEAGR